MKYLFFLLLSSVTVFGQSQQPHAAQIKQKLKKLNFLGSVLYVAAHPDDENTRVITYLANERLAATTYLSLTRGDGGQNLIGPELRDLLGLIRTQELLAARRIDGGNQLFTRANDFGFSKTAAESFQIWGKDEVLSDVVRAYRSFQPDVIITRFPPDERAGHGHHTASAILAFEAFDVSGDATKFPDQVKEFGVWKPTRAFINTGRFFNADINEKTPGVVTLDVGAYNSLLGQSYSEIAAESRTQHKSQGFGSQGRRGEALEFFELTKGTPATADIFDGVNTNWSRLPGAGHIQSLVSKAIEQFNVENPSASVPQLLVIRKAINALPPSVWSIRKLREVEQLIQDCLGLYVEVTADQYWISPGKELTLSFELVNRSSRNITLQQIQSKQVSLDTLLSSALTNNKLFTFRAKKKVIDDAGYSDPYWLREDHSEGLFKVPSKNLIGKPENDPAFLFSFRFDVDGEQLAFTAPGKYKWTDPVKGELARPVEIVPPVLVNLPEKVFIFPDHRSRSVELKLKSASNDVVSGTLELNMPKGWQAKPSSMPFQLAKKGDEIVLKTDITPNKDEDATVFSASVTVNGRKYNQSLQTVSYDHIPLQTLLPKAEAKLVHIDLEKAGHLIGYINGAGDEIPSALRNMGYEVWELKDEEITPANLARLDALVLGIRVLNTHERIQYFMPTLLQYVRSGGTLIMQYNTSNGLLVEKNAFSPAPLQLSRDRVTEENSAVRILKPEHVALNKPNKITTKDFDGWKQERGLYFPNQWDSSYEALLSMNDTNEPAREGSLLVTKYGEGHYIYAGLAFFRQLPEGVPGAYRLFANLVSLGSLTKATQQKAKAGK